MSDEDLTDQKYQAARAQRAGPGGRAMSECCQWDATPPRGWRVIQPWGNGLALTRGDLRVLIDCSEKADGKCWLHVSVSRVDRTPTHEEMASVKAAFLGDRYAYSVWPPSDKYVNIHKHCLHLWARLDGAPVLPEFDSILEGIGRSI